MNDDSPFNTPESLDIRIPRLFDDVITAQNDIADLISRLDEVKQELKQLQSDLALALKSKIGPSGAVLHRDLVWLYTIDTGYQGNDVTCRFQSLKTTTLLKTNAAPIKDEIV
ncbi:hypothetical protein U2F10_05325 [Leptothoe sp. EHU-05/26/07-4]